jgi:hypothetical protein
MAATEAVDAETDAGGGVTADVTAVADHRTSM